MSDSLQKSYFVYFYRLITKYGDTDIQSNFHTFIVLEGHLSIELTCDNSRMIRIIVEGRQMTSTANRALVSGKIVALSHREFDDV